MIRDEDEQLEDEFDFGTGYSDEPDFSDFEEDEFDDDLDDWNEEDE
jgi:hypothetical protein